MGKRGIAITFLGGASSIGASAALVEAGGARVLIDCGIRLNSPDRLPDLSPLSGGALDAILVTHAHTDHTGALPVAHAAFPAAPVYATPPTVELTSILFRDALRLMSGPEREDELPLYGAAEVESLGSAFVPVPFNSPVRIGELEAVWRPASHILGAAMVQLSTPAGSVLFTGDCSVSAQLTVPALARPTRRVDLVVSEATYGARLHEDRRAAETRLVGRVREVLERGGRALIPAFAIGRAQEVLLILRRALRRGELPAVPVHVDGMVRAVCAVYRRHEACASLRLARESRRTGQPFYGDGVAPVERPEDRARVLAGGPCVIVASSGMLAGGASAAYARVMAGCERDAIILTGYQDEESPGRALLELAGRTDAGAREIRLGGAAVPVKCEVGSYGLSAHADRLQLAGLIGALSPRAVALVHGDAEARESLARALRCDDVTLPREGETLVRDWPRRTARSAAADAPERTEVDVARARSLLGPPGGGLLPVREVARAWFGRPGGREEAQWLVDELERLGLARRDDARRERLRVLAPAETGAFPEEAEAEARLRTENPKGRLLELCMRAQCPPPEVEIAVDGAFHAARMSLDWEGRRLESGPHRAAGRLAAEQLAAAELLRAVTAEIARAWPAAAAVSDARAAELRAANPKGRLLELCAARAAPAPEFERRAVPEGYACRVLLRAGEGLSSSWHAAATRIVAEHAAADELLARLPAISAPEPVASATAAEDASPAPFVPSPAAAEPRALLNEMRQQLLLRDFGYSAAEVSGPPHRPVFRLNAWAETPDGERLEGAAAEAASKKAAQSAAAARLVELLRERGLVGGAAIEREA